MLILWIVKRKTNEAHCPQKYDEDAFRKHNEDMKNFYLSHPDLDAVSPGDILTPEGDLLAAMQCVKLNKNTQN